MVLLPAKTPASTSWFSLIPFWSISVERTGQRTRLLTLAAGQGTLSVSPKETRLGGRISTHFVFQMPSITVSLAWCSYTIYNYILHYLQNEQSVINTSSSSIKLVRLVSFLSALVLWLEQIWSAGSGGHQVSGSSTQDANPQINQQVPKSLDCTNFFKAFFLALYFIYFGRRASRGAFKV